MTSFGFAFLCGVCHPGGGPLETDRHGNRYDKFMKKNGLVPGGENGLDGDYFRSMWAKSGIMEADCLICHLSGYRYGERNVQVKSFNFRWAAAVGAGLGEVAGSVKKGDVPRLRYDLSAFNPDGTVRLRITSTVPRENCLNCHKESDYKKRGAGFKARDGVHARAGLRCVVCHWAGSAAADARIRGRELHEIGKGDDPGGHVRNDLDDTVRPCLDCHRDGEHGAPKAVHKELPPVHLEKIACVTCHVPTRYVKAALIQDATVYNPAPGIWPPPKRIWTFYGPDASPWNYYGEVHMEGTEFQRIFDYVPERAWYKGKIWPVNRVHSLWVGIKRPGTEGIDMVFMKDFFMMWKAHESDPEGNFPGLSGIVDDNKDGVPEVNRAGEVTALLGAVRSYLESKEKLPEGAQLVFIRDDSWTRDGRNWVGLEKEPWEASPYASVFKFSHDISPASSALGAKDCTECHAFDSEFFFRPVLTGLWDAEGKLTYEPNHELLGYTRRAVLAGAFRQEVLEPCLYWGMLFMVALVGILVSLKGLRLYPGGPGMPVEIFSTASSRMMLLVFVVALTGPGMTILFGRFVGTEVLFGLGLFHKAVAALAILMTLTIAFTKDKKKIFFWIGALVMLFQAATGLVLIFSGEPNLRQMAFTAHDVGALAGVAAAALLLVVYILKRGEETVH